MSVARDIGRILPINWRARQTNPPGPARFVDIIILVVIFISAIVLGSIIYDSGLLSDLSRLEAQLRGLRERQSTLEQAVADSEVVYRQGELEALSPHPAPEYLDAQIIGTHANVSWVFPGHDDGKHISYELQLLRIGPPGRACKASSDFFACRTDPIPAVFIASDVQNQQARIPPNPENTLASGRYVWRVAAIPTGSTTSDSARKDAPNLLSDWSPFATFTLYQSQTDRIATTHRVRVGTNLEQNTPFSLRDTNGYIAGFDIALIYKLVEQCLRLAPGTGGKDKQIEFDSVRCHQNVPQKGTTAMSSLQCDPTGNRLCVTLVPVHKWKDWLSALKRKEIDVFAGGVTRATARERGGVLFTSGYLSYNTELYTRLSDAPASRSLEDWLSKDRVVGVIQGSSNEDLLDRYENWLLESNSKLESHLFKVTYPSFPALESAMETGLIDGVLIDNTFVREPDWVALSGLKASKAWNEYIDQFIGTKEHEEIAIAVGITGEVTNRQATDPKDSLFQSLQSAITDRSIVNEFLPLLCSAYFPNIEMTDFRCNSNIGAR
jgi:ABC-type amino acid transport substrate-binding protein